MTASKFETKIKYIQEEILRLKTAKKYISVRSANYASSITVYTGLYRLTYEASDEPIVAIGYLGIAGTGRWLYPYMRTPINNTQIVEIDTTYFDGSSYITDRYQLRVISNHKITNIERVS